MKVTLSLDKSIEENASAYFEKGKKAKMKLLWALEAVDRTKRDLMKAMKARARLE